MAIRDAYPVGWQGGGVFTGDNYDELLKYQVQLHRAGEGVYSPDEDEKEFHSLDGNRRLIQSILGDVAIGDAFRVFGTGANNDFSIRGGDGTAEGAFHFFLRGFHVIVEISTTYLLQNTALNGGLVEAPTELTTPGGARTDEVYLEIFLLHVDGTQDIPLIPDGEATSKTNRLRLISQVLVAEGGTTPVDFVDGNGITHYTVKIATLERSAAQAAINAVDITDDRLLIGQGALGGDQTGGSIPAFNPTAMKVFTQETPDDTVRVPLDAVYISADGLRVVEFLAQSTGSFAPATSALNTRLYLVQATDAGGLDISVLSEVLTSTLDVFADHPDLSAIMQGIAIVRVDGDGAVTINQSDIYDIRHWLNKGGGGGGSLVTKPIDTFNIVGLSPQEFFDLSNSITTKDDINVYRNGQETDDFNITTSTQIQINVPSIPGTVEDETIRVVPRVAGTAELVVENVQEDEVPGDGGAIYTFVVTDFTLGDEQIFLDGELISRTEYTKPGVSQIQFTSIVPTALQLIRIVIGPKVTTTGLALEGLGVVGAGAGPTLKSPDLTQAVLSMGDGNVLLLNGVPVSTSGGGAGLGVANHVIWEVISTTQVVVKQDSQFRGFATGAVFTFAGDITLDITNAVGLLGLNTGSEVGNQHYYIIAVGDTTGTNPPSAWFVTPADYATFTVSNLPAGFDDFKRIGSVRNSSSDFLLGHYVEGVFYFDIPASTGGSSSITFIDQDLSASIPLIARELLIRFVTNVGASSFWRTNGSSGAGHELFETGEGIAGQTTWVLTDTAQIFEIKTTSGFLANRGVVAYRDNLETER